MSQMFNLYLHLPALRALRNQSGHHKSNSTASEHFTNYRRGITNRTTYTTSDQATRFQQRIHFYSWRAMKRCHLTTIKLLCKKNKNYFFITNYCKPVRIMLILFSRWKLFFCKYGNFKSSLWKKWSVLQEKFIDMLFISFCFTPNFADDHFLQMLILLIPPKFPRCWTTVCSYIIIAFLCKTDYLSESHFF